MYITFQGQTSQSASELIKNKTEQIKKHETGQIEKPVDTVKTRGNEG